MAYECPYCDVVGTYRENMEKHLKGGKKYGGHELPPLKTILLLDKIESYNRKGLRFKITPDEEKKNK
ncbi:MAG TPA: hypothetical protein VIL99_06220 [Ignavibacteria bacterium]